MVDIILVKTYGLLPTRFQISVKTSSLLESLRMPSVCSPMLTEKDMLKTDHTINAQTITCRASIVKISGYLLKNGGEILLEFLF